MAMYRRPHNPAGGTNPFTGRGLPAASPYRGNNNHGQIHGSPSVGSMAKKAALIIISFAAFFYMLSGPIEEDYSQQRYNNLQQSAKVDISNTALEEQGKPTVLKLPDLDSHNSGQDGGNNNYDNEDFSRDQAGRNSFDYKNEGYLNGEGNSGHQGRGNGEDSSDRYKDSTASADFRSRLEIPGEDGSNNSLGYNGGNGEDSKDTFGYKNENNFGRSEEGGSNNSGDVSFGKRKDSTDTFSTENPDASADFGSNFGRSGDGTAASEDYSRGKPNSLDNFAIKNEDSNASSDLRSNYARSGDGNNVSRDFNSGGKLEDSRDKSFAIKSEDSSASQGDPLLDLHSHKEEIEDFVETAMKEPKIEETLTEKSIWSAMDAGSNSAKSLEHDNITNSGDHFGQKSEHANTQDSTDSFAMKTKDSTASQDSGYIRGSAEKLGDLTGENYGQDSKAYLSNEEISAENSIYDNKIGGLRGYSGTKDMNKELEEKGSNPSADESGFRGESSGSNNSYHEEESSFKGGLTNALTPPEANSITIGNDTVSFSRDKETDLVGEKSVVDVDAQYPTDGLDSRLESDLSGSKSAKSGLSNHLDYDKSPLVDSQKHAQSDDGHLSNTKSYMSTFQEKSSNDVHQAPLEIPRIYNTSDHHVSESSEYEADGKLLATSDGSDATNIIDQQKATTSHVDGIEGFVQKGDLGSEGASMSDIDANQVNLEYDGKSIYQNSVEENSSYQKSIGDVGESITKSDVKEYSDSVSMEQSGTALLIQKDLGSDSLYVPDTLQSIKELSLNDTASNAFDAHSDSHGTTEVVNNGENEENINTRSESSHESDKVVNIVVEKPNMPIESDVAEEVGKKVDLNDELESSRESEELIDTSDSNSVHIDADKIVVREGENLTDHSDTKTTSENLNTANIDTKEGTDHTENTATLETAQVTNKTKNDTEVTNTTQDGEHVGNSTINNNDSGNVIGHTESLDEVQIKETEPTSTDSDKDIPVISEGNGVSEQSIAAEDTASVNQAALQQTPPIGDENAETSIAKEKDLIVDESDSLTETHNDVSSVEGSVKDGANLITEESNGATDAKETDLAVGDETGHEENKLVQETDIKTELGQGASDEGSAPGTNEKDTKEDAFDSNQVSPMGGDEQADTNKDGIKVKSNDEISTLNLNDKQNEPPAIERREEGTSNISNVGEEATLNVETPESHSAEGNNAEINSLETEKVVDGSAESNSSENIDTKVDENAIVSQEENSVPETKSETESEKGEPSVVVNGEAGGSTE